MRYPTVTSAHTLVEGDVVRLIKTTDYTKSAENVYLLITAVYPGVVDVFQFTITTEYREDFRVEARSLKIDSDFWTGWAKVDPALLMEAFARAHALSLKDVQEAKSRYLERLTAHTKYDAVLAFVGSESVGDAMMADIRAFFDTKDEGTA